LENLFQFWSPDLVWRTPFRAYGLPPAPTQDRGADSGRRGSSDVAQTVARNGCDLSFGAATSASRVTAVPRRSLKVTPNTPAFAHALPQEARKPSEVHGVPSMEVRMTMLRLFFAATSSASLRGAGLHEFCNRRQPRYDRRRRGPARRALSIEGPRKIG
jgi:hypothetical protein